MPRPRPDTGDNVGRTPRRATRPPPPTRREGDRELPLGPKARRTRAAILDAAGQLFAADGYHATSVADVAATAGVSLGTVYQYFRDRSELVTALVQEAVLAPLRAAASPGPWRAAAGRDGLYRVLHAFVAGYARTAAIAGVWEEGAHLEPRLAALRRTVARRFTVAVARELRRAGAAGLVDATLDPALTARALTGMVERFCYTTYVFDPPAEGPPSPDAAARLLTVLWATAVRLRAGEHAGEHAGARAGAHAGAHAREHAREHAGTRAGAPRT